MHQIIHYDIAALFIDLIIILLFFRRKNIPALQNRIFFSLLIDCFFTAFFEIISVVLISYPSIFSRAFLWFVNCMYFTCIYLFTFIACSYSISVVEFFETARRHKIISVRFFLFIPIIIGLIIIWISPLYDLTNGKVLSIFYLDENNVYQRGGILFFNGYLTALYYTFMALGFLLKYQKMIKTTSAYRMIFFFVLCYVGVVIQFFMPNVLLQCFVISLVVLVFEITIRLPDVVFDANTGLLNQVAFINNLNSQFGKQGKFACVGVVLDDVSFIINTFGVKQFNKLLRVVSDKLVKEFPTVNIYHIDQGRFVLFSKKTSKWDVKKISTKLQSIFAHAWHCDSMTIKLYVKICIIKCPADASKAEDIIDIINLTADNNQYAASVIYANQMDIEHKRRSSYIEHLLRRGIAENRFEIYYQPIYSTKKKKIIGAEALIRLRDDDGQFISPEVFIPIAEKTGIILRIGEFVFESVCKTLSEINLEECGIEKIDVNLSVTQCMQEILAEQILTIRKMYKVPTSVINMEITETAMAHTPEVLLKNIQKLVDAGIEFSLDDYGSGYSNMNYMLSIPFSMIKIDKGIVWSAAKDERAYLALKSTISLISDLEMSVLAEGVETEDQAKWLTELGCNYLQGFYFAKPMPKQEFIALMKKDKLT